MSLSFKELKKNLKNDFSSLKKTKVALLADSATQLYSQALRGYGFESGYNYELFEADYDQIDRQVFDLSSEFYKSKSEFVIIFHSVQKLIKKFYLLTISEKKCFAEKHIDYVKSLCEAINSRQSSKIIYFNFAEMNDGVFGNYSNKIDSSFTFQVRKINYHLMLLSQEYKNLFINDLNTLQSNYGNHFITESKIWINTSIVFSLDFLPIIAKNTIIINVTFHPPSRNIASPSL